MELDFRKSGLVNDPAFILAERKKEDLRGVAIKYLLQLNEEAQKINNLIKFMVQFFADPAHPKFSGKNDVCPRDTLFLAVSRMFECPSFDPYGRNFTQVPVAEQIEDIILKAVKFRAYLHLQKFIGAKNLDPPPELQTKIREL